MEINSKGQPNSSKRLIWIDVLKCTAMFLVLWGHCIQHCTNPDFSYNPVYLFIYSFHMPLFMILSGFFASKLVMRSFQKVFASKFLQLLLPTIVFGIIYWIQSRYLLHSTQKNIIQSLWYSFWFLKSLFVCIILFHIGSKMCKKSWLGLALMLIISQLVDIIPHLRFLQLRYMFPCFVIGHVLYHFKDYFYNNAKTITLIGLTIWCAMLTGFNHDLMYPNINNVSQIGGGKIAYLVYYKLMICISGSLGIIGIIYLLCQNNKDNKLLGKLAEMGRYTLAIYIIQTFVVESWLKAILSYPDAPYSLLFSLVYAPIISIIAMAVCLVICHGINKLKLDWLFDYNQLKFHL